MSATTAPPAERLQTCLAEGRWNELESVWVDNLAQVPAEEGFLSSVAEVLVTSGQAARAIALFQVLCPRLKAEEKLGLALAALKRIAPLAQDDTEIRASLVDAYRLACPDVADLDAFLRAAGLSVGGVVADGIKAMERFLRYRVGSYVYHEAAWGVGKVLAVNPTVANLLIDFEERKGHTVPIDGADKYLKALPADHLLAMRAFDLDRLKALAKQAPNVVVRKVLDAQGPKINLRDLKAALMPRVIASDDWSSWWGAAKTAVKKDPHIEMSASSIPTFELREVGVSQEEETLDRLSIERDPAKRLQMAYEWVRDAAAAGMKGIDAKRLLDHFPAPDPRDPHGLGLAFLREDLKELTGHEAGGMGAEALLREPKYVGELLSGVGPELYLKRAISLYHRIQGDTWGAAFVRLLTSGPEETWDFAVRELVDGGQTALVEEFLSRVLHEPESHHDQVLWLYRAKAIPSTPDVLKNADGAAVLRHLLRALDTIAARVARDPSPEGRKVVQKFRSGVSFKGYAPAKETLKKLDRDEAREFYWLAARNRGLSDQGKLLLTTFLQDAFAGLIEDKTKAVKKLEEEAVGQLYVTKEAYARKYKEFEHLVNVQMLENSEAIGKAMELGDLSENSEYSAALERQQQLAQKAKEMKADLDRARTIDPAGIKTEVVDIGTRVTVTNLGSSKQETWTILGPWDADPDRGVISYSAALGKTLMGKKPGEQVEFVHEDTRDMLRVEAIEKGM